jgi:hypothetical protein
MYFTCDLSLINTFFLCMRTAGNVSLIRNKSFILLALVYAVNMAIIITWQTLIDEFLDELPGFSISRVVSVVKKPRGSHGSSYSILLACFCLKLINFFPVVVATGSDRRDA